LLVEILKNPKMDSERASVVKGEAFSNNDYNFKIAIRVKKFLSFY
jgi:hypothetical protein